MTEGIIKNSEEALKNLEKSNIKKKLVNKPKKKRTTEFIEKLGKLIKIGKKSNYGNVENLEIGKKVQKNPEKYEIFHFDSDEDWCNQNTGIGSKIHVLSDDNVRSYSNECSSSKKNQRSVSFNEYEKENEKYVFVNDDNDFQHSEKKRNFIAVRTYVIIT